MRRSLFAKILLTVVLVFAAGACGSDSGTQPDPVATTSVSVQDDRYTPQQIVVSPGATVTWSWSGSNPHDVVWVGVDLPDSPLVTSGTHEVTMPQATGSYDYYCTEHGTPTSGMRGTVWVE